MTESQEKTKAAYESFDLFFEQFKPYDYHSKMVLEILFTLLLEKRNGKNVSVPTQKK
jgi:hypothetical protein